MKGCTLMILALLLGMSLDAKDVVLKQYGDGTAKVTAKLQKSIDDVSASGGGVVALSGGVFLTGPIELKSGVELRIEADATLLGSPDIEDYPDRTDVRHFDSSALPRWRNIALIYADEAENIAITGRGTIDCNGKRYVREKQGDWKEWQYERIVPREKSIPRAVFFAGCRNVCVRDITMTNQPAGWSYWIHDCDFVNFDGCKILADVHYPNNDGIHLNCSRDVTISNCIIETGDDSIVIRANSRSLKENKPLERIVVTNCTLRSWSSGVRIGWTNDGVIRNCTFSNIVMHDCSNAISCFLPDYDTVKGTNDYGREATLVENIKFSDIVMDHIYGAAIYVRVGKSPDTRFETFRNVSFSNIRCSCLFFPYFSGREGGPVEDVTFDNCVFEKYGESDFPGDIKRHGAVLRTSQPAENASVSYRNTDFIIK